MARSDFGPDVQEKRRTRSARIERLRTRLAQLDPRDDALVSILKGILDLLADEL